MSALEMMLRRLSVLLLLSAPTGAVMAAPKKACRTSLSQCPLRGCAKPGTPDALTNVVKHREPQGEARALGFQDFRSLQAAVEQLFQGHYHTLTKPDRARLRKLQIGGGSVGEGDLVELVGFIPIKPDKTKPHANASGESVNCRLTKEENNDIHISLVPKADSSEFEGVVIEMVPQQRDAGWSATQLKKVQQGRHQVRARGQLFFDNHHFVNDDPNNNISNQPKRIALWEIHPVTSLDVCTLAKCEPQGTGWKPLAEWQ